MDIRIRETEGTDEQPYLLWDSIYDNSLGYADWKVAPADEPLNSKGLQARHALHTAITLCLLTWRRIEDYEDNPSRASDPRGWWGDAVDIEQGEAPLGSKLWLLLRSPLNEKTRLAAIDYATEALTPLLTQGVVARFDVQAEMDIVRGYLALIVQAYSRDGQRVYEQKFERVWKQEFGNGV